MDGYLLINKPPGISSFGVVAKVRQLISQELGKKVKVGHTGTLDPFAGGLLILVVGKYTKQAELFSKLDKTYVTEMILGKTSTTGDPEGEIVEKSDRKPSQDEVKAVLKAFEGEIMQKPHKYSAVKINGQRAYKLARAGKTVETTSRQVKIHEITDVDYNYPKLKFTVSVSSGTYIRTLAENIGEELGTGAYLSALERTSVSDYQLTNAISLDNIKYSDIINNVKQIPPK